MFCIFESNPYPVYGDIPGLSVTIPDENENHKIVFHRLPKSDDVLPVVELSEDLPEEAETSSSNTSSGVDETTTRQYEVPAIFLAEKELSLFEVKALVSEKTWEAYKDTVLSYTGTDDDKKMGPYRQAVRDASKDFPAIIMTFDVIREICQTLNGLVKDDPEVMSSSTVLSRHSFRIPTKTEWQYAARATVNPEQALERRIFSKWSELGTRTSGKWIDICEKLKLNPKENKPTPDKVVEVADLLLERNRSKDGYRLLGQLLIDCLGFEINIAGGGPAQSIEKTSSPQANEWGFMRLLGNASEWTIDAEDINQAQQIWDKISAASPESLSTDTSSFGNVMGGQFLNTIPVQGYWRRFSIDGGQTKDGNPFTVQDFFGHDAEGAVAEVAIDLKAGCRLCLRLQPTPDWFVNYRRKYLQGEELPAIINEYESFFNDVCLASEYTKNKILLGQYLKFKKLRASLDSELSVIEMTSIMLKALEPYSIKGGAEAKPDFSTMTVEEKIEYAKKLQSQYKSKKNSSRNSSENQPIRGSPLIPNFAEVLSSINNLNDSPDQSL